MPEKVYEQIALAVEQLDVAVDLFLSCRSDVAALTLAGAAEEILGVALNKRGLGNALQMDHAFEAVWSPFGKAPDGWKSYRDAENYARNAAKHLKEDMQLTADLRRAAQAMIVRASLNCWFLEVPISKRIRTIAVTGSVIDHPGVADDA